MAVDLQLRAAFARSIQDANAATETGGDPSHKILLAEKGKKGLETAFRLLRKARTQNNVPGDEHQLRSPELLVLAAEAGVKNGEFDTAREACHEFFLDGGTRDQFYCRALFVKALVVNNSIARDGLVGAEATRRLSRAVAFLLQALDVAIEGGTRYAFLVYNASVHAWNILRPVLRAGRAGHHATDLAKFADALEAAADPDLRWRYTFLAAVSLALGDAGDAVGATARIAAGFQQAEAYAKREGELAETARAVVNEAKERVAVAQALIRRIEETGRPDATPRIDGRTEGAASVASGSEGDRVSALSLDTEDKVMAALSTTMASRAKAEIDVVEGTRKLEALAKRAAEASALEERAWILRAHAASEGAAAGGADAKKLWELSRGEAAGDPRKGALMIQQQVFVGTLTGDTALAALKASAEAVDPIITRLSETFLPIEDRGDEAGNGVRETEEDLALLPGTSVDVQSILVDLGRAALKAVSIEGGAGSAAVGTSSRPTVLAFAKACHVRASSSTRKNVASAADNAVGSVKSTVGDAMSSRSFRARLEFLGAELCAEGMMVEIMSATTKGAGVREKDAGAARAGLASDARSNGPAKLDARRTDALRLTNRVEALKRVERALLNSKRLGDPEILQEGCCLAFSVGFPLLGKRHRKHVHRCFSVAAQILQDLESPLARLRAQVHLEVAKSEMDSDFLVKAASHVDKALRQDYGVSDMSSIQPETPLDGEWDDEPGKPFSEGILTQGVGDDPSGVLQVRMEALNDAFRPLDRFMAPLADVVRLKLNVDVEPRGAEKKAVILIDQGKEAKDPFLRRTLLVRAAQQLDISAEESRRPRGDGGEASDTRDASTPSSRADATGVNRQLSALSEEAGSQDIEQAASVFAVPEADGSAEAEAEAEHPSSAKRVARLWFTLLELVWDQIQGGDEKDTRIPDPHQGIKKKGGKSLRGNRDVGLARRAAVAVLESGPWSPDKNRELVMLQSRAQFVLGETYVEELRLTDVGLGSDDRNGTGTFGEPGIREDTGTGTDTCKQGDILDSRTMGIATAACNTRISALVSDFLDKLKRKACGCFVAGMRRGLRARDPALVESGAVYIHNFHLPVWRRRLHHLATVELQAALEACVAALEALDRPATALLCAIYEALARILSAPSSSPTKAEDLCLRAITTLDRPTGGKTVNNTRGADIPATKAKGGAKKGDASSKGGEGVGRGGGGAAASRRATVSELKGLVEVRAMCQSARGGAGSVSGEGRPLLQALALLTAASLLVRETAGDLVERCATIMHEYRNELVTAEQAMSATAAGAGNKVSEVDGDQVVSVPAHGGGSEDRDHGNKIDVFAMLSSRKGTTLEEDQAEMELVGELWCRLGKEHLKRGMKRLTEECCSYVTELLPQTTLDRRRVHRRLWRWLSVAEGLWGQAIAAMVAPEHQEKPLQDELRRASMKHLALAAKCGTLAQSEVVTLDAARRLWNVAFPLAQTATGRGIMFTPLRGVLKEMAKGGVVNGGLLRAQLYVLLFECYSDRSEWKQGLAAVGEALQCVPPEFQRPHWQWRVVFLSRLGITSLDGLAKTKESDKAMQGKNWCTLARSSSDPKQQLSAYLKALECLGVRFERVEILVEMGEWMTGRGLTRAGSDYLRSALDLIYDVEEKNMTPLDGSDGNDRGPDPIAQPDGCSIVKSGTNRVSSANSGLGRTASKRSLASSRNNGGSRGSSRGGRSQGTAASTEAEVDQNGFPDALDMGHLETAVRILTMLARGCCASFDERLDVLMQAYYFLGRMAAMLSETVAWGHRRQLYEESVPEGAGRTQLPFEDWCSASEDEVYRYVLPYTACVHGTGMVRIKPMFKLLAQYLPPAPFQLSRIVVAVSPPRKLQLRDWAYWNLEEEHSDFNRWMTSPPLGRERCVIGPGTIEKMPLLFHHLLDLAEVMESHGLAAHAAAPLAMCELVARLCIEQPRAVSAPRPPQNVDDAANSRASSAKGKEKKSKNATSYKGGATGSGKEEEKKEGHGQIKTADGGEVVPAVALACLRRSRLLLKLGPTCQAAALKSAAAAGILGVSRQEAVRRGAEVDRILRQREESVSTMQGCSSSAKARTSFTGMKYTTEEGYEKCEPSPLGRNDPRGSRKGDLAAPRLGKLEDRKIWTLLANEAVMLGECRAATEYLAEAQRHNDAFCDRDNMISCLETQAALCEAKGHPEQALPCLLRAAALLRTPGVTGSTPARWGGIAKSVAGTMRRTGTGVAKARQALQAACDALSENIFEEVSAAEEGADDIKDVHTRRAVSLEDAVAFSGCASLLADISTTVEDPTSSSPSPFTSASRGTVAMRGTRTTFTATNATATAKSVLKSDVVINNATTSMMPQTYSPVSRGNGAPWQSLTLRILASATDILRPLGAHPSLPLILRQMARDLVQEWAATMTIAATRGTSGSTSCSGGNSEDGKEARENTTSKTPDLKPSTFLENAVTCLAEGREILSVLAASAEPVGETLVSCPVNAHPMGPQDEGKVAEPEAGDCEGNKVKPTGKGKPQAKKKGKTSAGASQGAAASPGEMDAPNDSENSLRIPSEPGGVSTPIGRTLVMVQLEEACLRAMLARAKGENCSKMKAEEAAANDKSITAVQRYMEDSTPVVHPTATDMELPQAEQALLLSGLARERSMLSVKKWSVKNTQDGKKSKGVTSEPEMLGLLSLALAWEGSALAMLAARGGLSEGAWAPRPAFVRIPTPPTLVEPTPAKGGKGGGKGGKDSTGGKDKKGGAATEISNEFEDVSPPILPMQEEFDAREQARWKLERATEMAVAAKRWDAVKVSSFALGELVGGDDSAAAVGALMLHQTCRARGRLLRFLREALPQPNGYRLALDRVTASQGLLTGMHNLDTCDNHAVPSSVGLDSSGGGEAGEGMVGNVSAFPAAKSAADFLESGLEGWRRLDCAEPPAVSLGALPEGLGILSLQISPDGTTLYAAGYARVSPVAVDVPPGDAECLERPSPAMVWRYKMKPSQRCLLVGLGLRMEAFEGVQDTSNVVLDLQYLGVSNISNIELFRLLSTIGPSCDVESAASVKRHCLEKGDEEGAVGDLNSFEASASGSSSSVGVGAKTRTQGTTPASSSSWSGVAECETLLDGICAGMESILSPLWAQEVEGGLAPFLDRCRAERLSLVLLLDEPLEKLPIEACLALNGIRSISRDLSLHMLRHRLKAVEGDGLDVSNLRMRYVADPLAEDPGIYPTASIPPAISPPPLKGKTPQEKVADGSDVAEDQGGRQSTLKTLREAVSTRKPIGGGKGCGDTGKVDVSVWKGIGGDDHVPGVQEWQSLICGEPEPEGGKGAGTRSGGGGFLYYGPGRCLSKLAPEHLAGLSANCKAAILVDRADNDASRRLESKQDTLKSQTEIALEGPAQTAALFSLAGCQSVVLNMWPVTLHNNRRTLCSLFRGWGDEGLSLGEALAGIRKDVALKSRSRFCTVLYGLPTLTYRQ